MARKRLFRYLQPEMREFVRLEVIKMLTIWHKKLEPVCINDYVRKICIIYDEIKFDPRERLSLTDDNFYEKVESAMNLFKETSERYSREVLRKFMTFIRHLDRDRHQRELYLNALDDRDREFEKSKEDIIKREKQKFYEEYEEKKKVKPDAEDHK